MSICVKDPEGGFRSAIPSGMSNPQLDGDSASLPTLKPSDAMRLRASLCEAAERGRTPRERRRLALMALSELINADSWIWCYSFVNEASHHPKNIDYQHCGRVPFRRGIWYAFRAYGIPKNAPENDALYALVWNTEPFTRSIHDLVGMDFWQNELECRAHVARLGIDEIVFSIRPLACIEGRMVFFGASFGRREGREPFTPYQKRMIHEAVARCVCLRPGVPSSSVLKALDGLTLRFHRLLALMREGLSNREMGEITAKPTAEEGGAPKESDGVYYKLTRGTVVEMKNTIFRRFGVDAGKLIEHLQRTDHCSVQRGGDEAPWDESARV